MTLHNEYVYGVIWRFEAPTCQTTKNLVHVRPLILALYTKYAMRNVGVSLVFILIVLFSFTIVKLFIYTPAPNTNLPMNPIDLQNLVVAKSLVYYPVNILLARQIHDTFAQPDFPTFGNHIS